ARRSSRIGIGLPAVKLPDLLYPLYERRLQRELVGKPKPRHVGVMLDGNRRWARSVGLGDPRHGYQAGAAKVEHFLRWCDDAEVELVTLWLLSTENLNRPPEELEPLLGIIEGLVTELAADGKPWQLRIVGAQ